MDRSFETGIPTDKSFRIVLDLGKPLLGCFADKSVPVLGAPGEAAPALAPSLLVAGWAVAASAVFQRADEALFATA
jgi:hypothetical protein